MNGSTDKAVPVDRGLPGQQEGRHSATLAPRQLRGVLLWKLVEYAGMVLFATVVPSRMGPDEYGRFAGLLALVALLGMLSGLGALTTFGRFMPQYRVRGEYQKIRVLFTQVFLVRILVAILLAVTFLFAFPRLLPQATHRTVLLGLFALFLSVPAATCFQLFHGLNSQGRWLSQDALMKIVLLLGLLATGGLHDSERAALALLATHAGFLLVGLWWTRSFFAFGRDVAHPGFLYENIRFGLLFFLSSVFLMAVWRAGELTLLIFSVKTSEVAFFNVANILALLAANMIGQFAAMLTPSLAVFHVSDDETRLNEWLGRSLKYLTTIAFVFVLGVHTFGEWGVRKVWGGAYLPVVENLGVLSFGVLAVPLVRTVITLAILRAQPAKVFRVAAGASLVFVIAAAILVPRYESLGASISVTTALVASGFIAYHQFPLGGALGPARYWAHAVLGGVSLGFLALPCAPMLRGLLACAAYAALMHWGRVFGVGEIRNIGRQLLGGKGA